MNRSPSTRMNDSHAAHLRITPMMLDDVPAVGALERVCFTSPWSEQTYRHELMHNARSFYYVMRAPARSTLPPLLGYGGYWILGDEAHIVTLASHPALRGHHIGELMLLHLIGRARDAAVELITLEVRVGNSPARGLYAKVGFEQVGLRKRYYRDNGEDALLLTLSHVAEEQVWTPMSERYAFLLAMLDVECGAPNP